MDFYKRIQNKTHLNNEEFSFVNALINSNFQGNFTLKIPINDLKS